MAARASAQIAVAPNQVARTLREFESHPGDTPLRCEVTPLPPALNFAFRYHAGYTFHVPLDESAGPTQGWSVLTIITPQGARRPAVLLAHHQLADATKTDKNFDVHGLYFLGVGRYSVEAALRDSRNRICRKQWQIVVKPSRAGRNIRSALPPNAVRESSLLGEPETRHPDNAAPLRLSVLLNAAAFSVQRTSMRSIDRLVLLSALTALVERLPTTSVRLVVFSLEQQREVFRTDNFTPPQLSKVADAISTLQLTTVDIHVLQRPLGHLDFLTGLINRELRATTPADKVVFLGPPSRFGNKIPEVALPKPTGAIPRFFYLQYQGPRRPPIPADIDDIPASGSPLGERAGGLPPQSGSGTGSTDSSADGAPSPPPPPRPPPNNTGTTASDGTGGSGNSNNRGTMGAGGGSGGRGGGRRGGSSLPPIPPPGERQSDIINQAVARLKGTTLTIHSPADLAKAIQKIEQKR